MKLYFFPILIIFLVSFNYAFAEGDQTKDVFDYPEIITAIIVAPLGGLVGYVLKRHFVNKDFEFQQKIERQHWLLQQFSPLSSEYYVPLAKFAFDSFTHIERSQSAKNLQSVEIAYYHTCLLLSKYISFKNERGANFLFINSDYEGEAIITIRAILSSFPFDDQDLITIHNHITTSKSIFTNTHYKGITYDKFKSWILSDNCVESRKFIIEQLFYFQRILDQGGEEIAHPRLIDKSNLIIKSREKDDDIFYILSSSAKKATAGDKIQIFGGGFKEDRVTYDFYIGNNVVATKKDSINNNVIEFTIPNNLLGSYDIFSKFKVLRWQRIDKEDTIGIPIHIV